MDKFNHITTVIFDLGGVLLNLNKESCIQGFKEIGIPDMENQLDNCIQSGFFLDFETGKISEDEFRNEIRALSDRKLSDELIDQAWNSFLVDIPDEKLDLILQVRERFSVLMLSNTCPTHSKEWKKIFKAHKGLELSAYFDKCYLSYELGLAKPSAAIFEAVMNDANVRPENCLFLDDGEKNIEQAKKLGFQTRLVVQGEDLNFLLNTNTWK